MRVQSGSLDASRAVFNVTHTGVNNNYDGNYNELNVRSYAVRVMGAEGDEVKIAAGTIENSVGGGLYVSGGTVNIGVEEDGGAAGSAQLAISATGSDYDKDTWYDTDGETADGTNAWHYHKNISGGHAVEVVGGTLTINGGRYTANMGNGILVQEGEARVEDGTFIGADAYTPGTEVSEANAGPAASYAFKLYGGELIVNGGTFTDQATTGTGSRYAGSGAFVMGGASQAQVTVNAGIFNVRGTAAFAVYSNASVTFGAESDDSDEDIQLSAESAAITVENTNGSDNSVVNIYSGTYWCNSPESGGKGSDGIFYGEGTTKLNIYGGVFSGVGDPESSGTKGRSGLYIAVNPGTNIQISGGTFIGQEANRSYATGSAVHYWSDGGAVGAMTETGSWGTYTGLRISVNNVLRPGCSFYNVSGSRLNYEYIHTYNGLWNYSSLAEETQVSVR